MSQKVADAEGLFDLFEKYFNAPAAFVKGSDGAGGPWGIVGDEGHQHAFAVEFDEHFHSPQFDGILFAAFANAEQNEIVTLDVALGLFEEFLSHGVSHVVFGSGNPVDAALMQGKEVLVVDVGFVEEHDFTFLEVGAELLGAGVVVVAGFFDDGTGGKKGLEVEAQVHFGSSFAAAVFGPVERVGYERDGAGVNCGYGLGKSTRQSLIADAEALWRS